VIPRRHRGSSSARESSTDEPCDRPAARGRRGKPNVQVTLEKLGPCQAKIHFTVPGEEFQGVVRRAYAHAGRNVRMKGFRPGHVPEQVIEKQFGPQIKNDAIEHFVRQAFEQAVKENSLKVVGFQRVNLEDVKVVLGGDFTHEFEVSLRPEIALGDYKGIAIESELEPVMDHEVDDALKSFRAQQSTPHPAGDAGLPIDGMALVKVEWLHDGKTVLSRDGLRLSPESPTPGTDPEAFKTAMQGVHDGETRELPMIFPEEFDQAELRGKPGLCRLSISQAFRMVPPTDEEVRRFFDAQDEAALKKTVHDKIEEAKREQENQRIESALVEKLLAMHEFELPQMMLDEQTNQRLAQLSRQLEQQGTPPERIQEQLESQRDATRDAAARGMRALFLIQAVAEKENLLVNREDMQAEVKSIAERNNSTLEEVSEYYKKNNLFDQMAIEILERKVRKFLRENAKVTEPS
jgi:trigger factor